MLNQSSFQFLAFALPQWQRSLLSLVLGAVWVLVVLANGALVLVVSRVRALWSPMYVLVGALCVVDLLSAVVIVPQAMMVLLSADFSVSLDQCLTQMFFTHFLSSLESTLLLAMALDRYVAICHPLRYRSVVNGWFFLALSVFTLTRSGSVMGVLVGLAGSLDFCGSRVVEHLYCDHMALVRLGCGDTRASRGAGVAVIAVFVGLDIPLITLSYLLILREVQRSGQERWRALHTCGTHLMVLMVFYLVGSVAFLSYNLNLAVSADVNTAMGLLYILLPAAVNPIIYGVRTAEIRLGLSRVYNAWTSAHRASIKVCPWTNPGHTGSGPAHRGSGPAQQGSNSTHRESGPAHRCSNSTHRGSSPAHRGSSPAQRGSNSTHIGSNPTQQKTNPSHRCSRPSERGSDPTPQQSNPAHIVTNSAHGDSVPATARHIFLN